MSTKKISIKKNQPVIKCDSVYKIFGDNAKKLLHMYSTPPEMNENRTSTVIKFKY